jgi:hypothetical protein
MVENPTSLPTRQQRLGIPEIWTINKGPLGYGDINMSE